MKLNKEQKEKAAYIWEGIKTGTAKSHHYKVEMIKFHNELKGTRYRYTTSCSSCLGTCMKFIESIVIKPKKKTKKKDGGKK
tara:strand:+ start:67 stop:309 length:243 start_codon:yes stop_codon:yes gene_type:complete